MQLEQMFAQATMSRLQTVAVENVKKLVLGKVHKYLPAQLRETMGEGALETMDVPGLLGLLDTEHLLKMVRAILVENLELPEDVTRLLMSKLESAGADVTTPDGKLDVETLLVLAKELHKFQPSFVRKLVSSLDPATLVTLLVEKGKQVRVFQELLSNPHLGPLKNLLL